MSDEMMGNGKSNVPPPPPPPPLKEFSKERMPKLKTKKEANKKSPPTMQFKSAGSRPPPKPQKPTKQILSSGSIKTPPVPSNFGINDDEQSDDKINALTQSSSQKTERNFRARKKDTEPVVEIVRNDVPFFDEEQCTDSEDDFAFPCCLQPNSPRYPPNPRPYREWDPAFLPSSTNIPTSIGKQCKRCGNPVFVAELYMSSRGVYHSECYKCCLCGKSLDSWSVAEFKGEVFCKGCYRRNFGTHGCGFGVGAGVLQTP